MEATEQSDAEKPGAFKIGVLLIHGIGAQQRGQTLAEFGAPIFHWLSDRYRGLDHRWRKAIEEHPDRPCLEQWRKEIEQWANDGFHPTEVPSPPDLEIRSRLAAEMQCPTAVGRVLITDSVIEDHDDPKAPARAELRIRRLDIDGKLNDEQWLLAESWWADTFAPPRFADLAKWGLRIIPWTVGHHFGAQMRRALNNRPSAEPDAQPDARQSLGCWLIWLAGLLLASVRLLAGLLLSPLLLAALVVLLAVSLLPFPAVREALLKIQLLIASTLGDSYVLVSRPIEAASIISQVRRDLRWLEERCQAVAIVAHSQGGAVAHMALQASMPSRLRLLFTFGSGLKKLEEQRYLLSSGTSYVRSGVYTLVALLVFSLGLAWFILLLSTRAWERNQSDIVNHSLVMLGWLLVSAIFLRAGLRDYLGGIELADVRRWVRRLMTMPFAWVDCFATADPVSNGALVDDPAVTGVSTEVCNRSSSVKDHNSYWSNRDQFVTLLLGRLTRPELRQELNLPPATELETDRVFLNWIGARRRWRIGVSRAIGFIGFISVLIAALQEPQAWAYFLVYLVGHIRDWFSFDDVVPATNPFKVSWPALGYLALVAIPWGINRWLWHAWNEREMRAITEYRIPPRGGNTAVATGVLFQVWIAAGILYGNVPPFWLIFVSLFGLTITMFMLEPGAPRRAARVDAGTASGAQDQTNVDRTRTTVVNTLSVLVGAFSMGLVAWTALTWLADRRDGSLFGFQPNAVSSIQVGAIVAVLWAGGTLLWTRRRRGS